MIRNVVAGFFLASLLVATVVMFVRQSEATLSRRFLNMLFPLSQFVALVLIFWFVFTYGLDDVFLVVGILSAAICIVTDITLSKMLQDAEEKELAEERVRILREQVTMQEEYYVHLSQEMDEAEKVRARIARELDEADEFLRQEEGKRAVEQLKATVDMMEGSEHYCEHRVVDALLATKTVACDAMGVHTEFKLSVPYDLPVSSVDLCAIFSNTIDNALHACEKLEPEKRTIRMKAGSLGGFFVLDAVNSCVPDEQGEGVGFDMRRRGKGLSEHGWGLLILQNIAERYDGSLSVEHQGDVFQTTVALKLPA